MPSLDAPGVAYVIDWRGYRAPRLLNQLLESDVAVYAAPVPIDIATADGTASFPAGALIVPWNQDPLQRRQAVTHLRQAVRKDGVRIRSTVSALTPAGPDLGSDRMVRLSQPKVLLVAGVGASAYEAGEVWYVADRQLSMTITMAAASRLSSLDLSDYNRIVFVSGRHVISSAAKSKLEAWVQRGGTLIVYGGALPALQSAQLLKNAVTPQSDPSQSKLPLIDRKPYGDAKTNADLQLLRGAILRTRVDTTHPLGFGLPDTLPVFRNHENLITPANNVYANPLVYDANPVMSGYVSQENRQMLSRSASVVVRPQGNGRIIVLAENPNFRAFWLGTQRLFYNALFLPDMISNSLSD